MDFQAALEKNKAKILDLWFDATIRTYPEDTARMFLKIKNRFDNPVGSMTWQSLNDTFSQLSGPLNSDSLEKALDPVIRIRAIQSFTPSQAVGFVFELKSIVKKVLGSTLEDTFDRNVDQIGLAAFNRFMKCREEIFLLKANEAKDRIHSAFKRAGLVSELEENGLPGSNKS
ncbi:MAG: RsbRD N-terminal domain-containing protein [Pseudomonadota bacterium]